MPLFAEIEIWIIVAFAIFVGYKLHMRRPKKLSWAEREKRRKKEEAEEKEREKREQEEYLKHQEFMKAFWPKYLHKGKILESWATMVDGGKGQSLEFINRVLDRIQAVNIPDMKGEARGLFFDRFLQNKQMFACLWRDVEPLRICKIFIGVEDYGENMSVNWYLLWDGESWWNDGPENNDAGKMFFDMLFQAGHQRALKDFVGIIHKIILDETKQTMNSLNLDFSKVDVHTNGFLNLP